MNYFPESESGNLEFKREIPKNDQLVKTIIGFANQHGGRIIIGISDDKSITGFPEDKIQDAIESIQNSFNNNIFPQIIPSIYTRRFDDKIVLIIEASRGTSKPYFKKSEGLMNGTYIRIGMLTVKATEEMIQELQWQSRGMTQDMLPVYRATIGDLDQEAILRFLRTKLYSINVKEPTPELLRPYHLITEEHSIIYPTVGAMLLFGKNPQYFLSESFIICSHFKGTSGRDIIATRDCNGTLFEQYQNALEFIIEHIDRSIEIKGGKRKEVLEIPENAIREALLNVIVHRNYRIQGPTKIAIYQDRLEFFSPGSFPGPIRIKDLELGLSYIRNPVICKVFREAGYIEKLGSGFPTIFQSMRSASLRTPQVIESDEAIKIVLPRGKESVSPEGHEKIILDMLLIKPAITVSEVMNALSISRTSAWRILHGMISKKIIVSIGKGRTASYGKF